MPQKVRRMDSNGLPWCKLHRTKPRKRDSSSWLTPGMVNKKEQESLHSGCLENYCEHAKIYRNFTCATHIVTSLYLRIYYLPFKTLKYKYIYICVITYGGPIHTYIYIYIYIYSRGNIPIFRKSSHTMFSSYSRPGFWYVTLIGISAQSGGNSWPTANPLNAPPQLSIPYVVPKQLWTLNELKAALIRKFPHLSTQEGQGCQR